MPTIGWNESQPQGIDSIAFGDDEIRSLKTALRNGLDEEHVWPSGGGDAGVHRLGSGRPYVDTQSMVSSSGSDGRLMWASDTSRFFHVGSGGTAFIGGQNVVSVGSAPVGGQRFYWAIETGEDKIVSSGQLVVTFPNSGFSGAPFVQVTPYDPGQGNNTVSLTARTATTFTVNGFNAASSPSNISFTWISVGTRTF